MNNFVFHTAIENQPIKSQNTHFNPWAQYLSGAQLSGMSRFNDGEAIPVQLVNEWPSNDDALGGALFEVANFIYGSTGICTLDLPSSVYWFHTFNAHIVPSESNPSAGRYGKSFENNGVKKELLNDNNIYLSFFQRWSLRIKHMRVLTRWTSLLISNRTIFVLMQVKSNLHVTLPKLGLHLYLHFLEIPLVMLLELISDDLLMAMGSITEE